MIKLSAIRKTFAGHRVLHDVDLQLNSGTVTALIGPSGSGKSTLLRCVNLLEMPESGTLQIGAARVAFSAERRPSSAEISAVRAQTGMIFQNFQLFPHLTVVENVMEGLRTVLKWERTRAYARALALLDRVGIANKADAWPITLSGGQQQRVAIARALASSPLVLLCDEPSSALDPELAAEVIEVLKQLARDGTTMLMATHDLRLAASIADNAIFLKDGVVVESGPSDVLFSQPSDPRTMRFIATLKAA